MKKAVIYLETLTCPSCTQKIENAVKSMNGVDKESISVLFNSSKVKFNFDDTKIEIKDIENAINKLGYDIKKSQVN